jgi:hypothetical protein
MQPRPRAALIALALALGLVDGLPLPPPERQRDLAPVVQGALGVVALAQAAILAPFRPLARALVVTERWVLFAGASRERFRFELSGRRGGHDPWQLLYRADDPEHRFLAGLIEYRRVRGAWNPRTQLPPEGYDAFASFVAGRVFAERPDLSELRLRMERIRIEEGGGYTGTGEFAHELRRRRRHPRRAREAGP